MPLKCCNCNEEAVCVFVIISKDVWPRWPSCNDHLKFMYRHIRRRMSSVERIKNRIATITLDEYFLSRAEEELCL